MSSPDIAIVGGGLCGRLLAWRIARAGLRVALYDAASRLGEDSAAWVAAGMVAPAAESIDVDAEIVSIGKHSLSLWPQWLRELPQSVFFRDTGTLLLWHREDAGEARHFERMLAAHAPGTELVQLDSAKLQELEPNLSARFQHSLYLPGDAQLDNREVLSAIAAALEETGVTCYWQTAILEDALPTAGVVVDCRGMGARRNWPQLRGVRGEIIRLHAPELPLGHMLRLLHPRYSVYVVPRAEGRLVVGATSIESDDRSPVSVRGALELLSSAYSMLPGLAEARVLEFSTQVRPALPDNRPAFCYDRGRRVLSINGLYRHGFLLSPTVVEEAMALLSVPGASRLPGQWRCLYPEPSGAAVKADDDIAEEVSTCLLS
jgi:glycine oxidase